MMQRAAIYRLLYLALADIRAERTKHDSGLVFHLADLFHPLLPELERAAQGRESYDNLLSRVRERARQQGLAGWLDGAIKHHTSWHLGESRTLLHRVLYQALVDVRLEAHEGQDNNLFCIADLFHNIPLRIDLALRGEDSFDEVLSWLRRRAQINECEAWLDQAIEVVTRTDPDFDQANSFRASSV